MFSLPVLFFLAALFGAIVGLEREAHRTGSEEESVGGIRTYALIGLIGGLAGFFWINAIAPLALGLLASVVGLLIVYYALHAHGYKQLGVTTELSVIITFVVGFLTVSKLLTLQNTVIILILSLITLAVKKHTHHITSRWITAQELPGFISYALIALVILPILPDQSIQIGNIPFLQTFLHGYGLELGQFAGVEIFNPRKIWFIVALVTGIDVLGYILNKIFGAKKSFTLASLVGGFISSTSTTVALAQKSRVEKKHAAILVGAALLANVASFFQVFLLVGPLNSAWLVALTPTLLSIVGAGGVVAAYFLIRGQNKTDKETKTEATPERRIFDFMPALKFACLLIAVKFVTKICLILFGNSGFIISSVIASFAGIDAIVLNLADMAGRTISFQTAIFTFCLVNATNLLTKTGYSFAQGSRAFAWRFLASALIIIIASLITLII